MDLAPYPRIVVKVGSALLVDQGQGVIRKAWMRTLCDDLSVLSKNGHDVVVVSSGAVALGRHILKFPAGPIKRTSDSQAAAIVGQPSLMNVWIKSLRYHGIVAGQGLLTKENIESETPANLARKAFNRLMELKVIPIVNENDAVATREIVYGDNDRLAAYVAKLVNADMLILLSDIDGLYTANPSLDKSARHIPVVDAITPDIEAMAGDALSDTSRGGMKTKVMAAQIATDAGCAMMIAKGYVDHPLRALSQGAQSTLFKPRSAQPF